MHKLLIATGLLLMLNGCYNDKYDKLYPAAPACDTTAAITYSHDIQPIIAANCYSPGSGCHDAAGSSTSGYDYQSTPLQLISNAKTMKNGSTLLLGDLNWLSGFNPMPKNSTKIAACDLDKITKWVNAGAPNN